MRLPASLLAVAFALPAAAAAGEPSRLGDLVQVRDGKFVSESYSLCEVRRPEGLGPPPRFQMRLYSEAPAKGVVSRDYFVAYTANVLATLRMELAARTGVMPSQANNFLVCREVSAPIGSPDVELRVFIAADGMQVEVVDTSTGRVSRTTSPWE
jgi:hypothetical protein